MAYRLVQSLVLVSYLLRTVKVVHAGECVAALVVVGTWSLSSPSGSAAAAALDSCEGVTGVGVVP